MCVTDSSEVWTQPALRTVKIVKPFATWQHLFDIDSIFLSYPSPLSLVQFTQNVISLFAPKFHRNPLSIRVKRKKMPMLARDFGTTGHRPNKNIIASAAHGLQRHN